MLTQNKIELNDEIRKMRYILQTMQESDWPEANIQYAEEKLARLMVKRRNAAVENLEIVQITHTDRGSLALPAVEIEMADGLMHIEFDWIPFLDGSTEIFAVQVLVTHHPDEGEPRVSPLAYCHDHRIIPAGEAMTWDTDVSFILEGLDAPRAHMAPELTLADLS